MTEQGIKLETWDFPLREQLRDSLRTLSDARRAEVWEVASTIFARVERLESEKAGLLDELRRTREALQTIVAARIDYREAEGDAVFSLRLKKIAETALSKARL